MFSLLFRNRWFAVAWVVLMLVSVSIFAGKDGGAQQLAQSAKLVREQREAIERPVVPTPVSSLPVSSSPALPQQVVIRAPDLQNAELSQLEPIPGSGADLADPRVGDVFVNPVTGHRMRVVRRSEYREVQVDGQPADYSSSSAASPNAPSSSSSLRSPR